MTFVSSSPSKSPSLTQITGNPNSPPALALVYPPASRMRSSNTTCAVCSVALAPYTAPRRPVTRSCVLFVSSNSRYEAGRCPTRRVPNALSLLLLLLWQGVVQPEVFTQPHYLGGRSLRLEKSRVRSNDLTTAVAMAAARSTPSPVPIEVSTPSKWHFAPYGPPPLIFYTLFVGGFSPEEGTRKALFHRFKRYGYVLGVELQWLQGYTKIAYIYYESGEAVQAAIRENVQGVWGACSRPIIHHLT